MLFGPKVQLDALGGGRHLDGFFHVKFVLNTLKTWQYDEAVVLDVNDGLELAFYQAILDPAYLFMKIGFGFLQRTLSHIFILNNDGLELLILLEGVGFLDISNLDVNLMSVVD